MRISIPGHVFLNFSGTAQNWMAIVAQFFLSRAWLPRRNKPQWGLSNFIGAWPKHDAKIDDASHHDELSMLMVASHGCIGWWSWSMFNEERAVFHQCSLLVTTKAISFISSSWSSRLRWCNFITQLDMNQMFPRRSIDVGTKSKSFVLIYKPSHNFVFSYPVILFVQLLTKYVVKLCLKTWCGLKTRMEVVPLHFYLLCILDLTEVKLCKVWPSL